MSNIMVNISNVSKQYKLGQIGGTTLRDELQRKWAKRRGKEDPTSKIGTNTTSTGESFLALNNVSFIVNKGERVGIIGHNGAGKSTLLKLLSRVTAPSEGKIGLNGRIASMLEVGTGFHAELTGRENIYMNGAILGMTKKEIDAKMEDIIEFSECRQFIDTPVKRYSSGMYVKLAFSVAAHLDSEIMIMDEVLAVGDMTFQQKCLKKMNSVAENEGRTILYVSHNMNTIRQLCDRVIVLSKGKVIFDGDVEKGIEIYLSANELSKSKHNILDRREHDGYISSGVMLRALDFISKDNTIEMNEPLRFVLFFDCERHFDSLRFRIVVTTTDGSPIATSHTDPISCDKTNNKSVDISLDLSTISPGDYLLRIIAFTDGEYGKQVRLDDVPNAGAFSISENYKVSGMKWSHKYWGYTELKPAELVCQDK